MIATTVSLVAPASASGVEIGAVASGIADFFGWVDSMYSAFESLDSTMENSGFYDALDRETSAYCSDADTATGGRYPYHRWGGAFLPSNQRCDYCGVEYSTYKALLSRGYGGFTDSFPAGLNATSNGVSAAGVGFEMSMSSCDTDFWQTINVYEKARIADVGQFMLLGAEASTTGFYGLTICQSETGAKYLALADVSSLLPYTAVDLPLGEFVTLSAPLLVYEYNSNSHWICYLSYADFHLDAVAGLLDATCCYMTSTTCVESITAGSTSTGFGYTYPDFTNYYSVTSTGGEAVFSASGHAVGYRNRGSSRRCYSANPLYHDCTKDYPHDTRCTSLTAALNEWNEKHLIESGSPTINYYISPVGTEDTYYHPGLYDEETLVYTDPVTGMEYLTTGWTYDYLTRCYSLTMGDTFVIGDTTITRIDLTYGDDVLTVDHYDASGNLVQTDTYNYVVASGSECGLNGHSYTYENVIDATCIAPGERKFTCSVCGDEYAEEIPQIDHVYADYTVTHDPTCTSKGISSYSCSACGGAFTELLDALGHDWQPTAATEEAYVMPDDVNCPDCHGTVFSHVRHDSEIIAGGKNLCDLSILKPGFSSRYLYLSAVGAGYLEFVAPAGLSSSGYYNSGIPLKDFASGLTAGETYTLSFLSEGGFDYIYLDGVKVSWHSGASLVITEAMLNSSVVFYGPRTDGTQTEAVTSQIFDFQIELGSEATEYEPYDPEMIEIVPPLYIFTCSDSNCGAVWTEEAEFRGASVTFSCTRCGAEKIEVEEKPIEEEGWFDWIGKQFRTLISAIVNGLASGLEFLLSEVIVTTVSWLINIVEWVFGLFDSSSLTEWFNWFDDSNPAFSEWSEQTVWGS